MTKSLPKSALRVQDFLEKQGFTMEVKELSSSTKTALDAANSIGCTVAQIAKSLIFQDYASKQPILVIASGCNTVSVEKIKQQTGLILTKADGKFIKQSVGFAIGGIPPVAHNTPLKTLLDSDLKQYDVIWAAAGTPFSVFSLNPIQLADLTKGDWYTVSEPRESAE